MSNSAIWLIDRALSCTTTLSQSVPGSDRNEEVLRILQSFSITGASLSDYLGLYPGHLQGWSSYPSTEMQLVYSITPDDWATYMPKL